MFLFTAYCKTIVAFWQSLAFTSKPEPAMVMRPRLMHPTSLGSFPTLIDYTHISKLIPSNAVSAQQQRSKERGLKLHYQ
jgi:hypothetical protein